MNMRAMLVVGSMALASSIVAASCGDDSGEDDADSSNQPTPCNEDPWQCPEGQTCWVNNSFAAQCLNSGPAAAGDSCNALIGAPTCGDDLICLQQNPSVPDSGVCSPYCDPTDPAHACPAGSQCVQVKLQHPQTAAIIVFQACFGQGGTGGEGGGGGSGGAGGTGGAAGGEGGLGGAGGSGGAPGGGGGAGGA